MAVIKLQGCQDSVGPLSSSGQPDKKILIACSHFWPSVGGLESRIEQFGLELVKAGYKVSVITAVHPGRDREEYRGIRILSVKPGKRVPVALGWPFLVRKAVQSGEYDACILIQDPLAEIIWSVEGVIPPPRTRLIIQPVINEDGYARWKDDELFVRRLCKILKRSAAVIAMTRTGPDQRFMSKTGISPVYIPNATALPDTTEDFRAKYNLPRDVFVILHVANLYWVKNHLGLMETLRELPTSWQLVMIGNPTGEPDCARAVLAELSRRPEILYLPGLNRADVANAMEAADVVVLSSLGEGSPNTILEAMAHKKPWLATPQCGAANDNAGGIICHLSEFAEYLAVLEEAPEIRSELGAVGYRHWQDCFSWPRVVDAWIDLIEGKIPKSNFTAQGQVLTEAGNLRRVIGDMVYSFRTSDDHSCRGGSDRIC